MDQQDGLLIMDELERFNKFTKLLSDKLSGFKIKYKNESFLMKLISCILFFNKSFMTNYVTTLGYAVYFPSKEKIRTSPTSNMVTLSHEYVHASDANKYSRIIFSILYLLPQILFLLIIPMSFIIGLWSLLFLCFLAPLPAYFRTKFEIRGYTMSLFSLNELMLEENKSEQHRKDRLNRFAERINKKHFKGPTYYFMWPFGVKNKLNTAIKNIISGDILKQDRIFREVRGALAMSKI